MLRLSVLYRVCIVFGLLWAAVLAACSSGDQNTNEGTGSDCDDGESCTIDAIVNGVCTHSVGPASGDTACPPGQFCTLGGCVKAPACATRADCEKAWMDEPCRTNPRCDAASSVCVFDPLDKDKDGHAPVVCGGDDCDDGNPSRAPGQDEVCDGIDNDCDGAVDRDASCSNLLESCHEGACECPEANQCGTACVDMETDANNCGSCHHACAEGFSCDSGECTCPAPAKVCGEICVEVKSDAQNCGGCGIVCANGGRCDDGTCTCPGEQGLACGGTCRDVANDSNNCGKCAAACPAGASCAKGACECPGAHGAACGESCVDLDEDEDHCGGCGNACPNTASCVEGTCECPDAQTICADTCVDTGSDADNCGGCGVKCDGTCGGGRCYEVLASGYTFTFYSIVLDASNVYFGTSDQLVRVPKSGGKATPLATAQGCPAYIALDATNIYWMNGCAGGGEIQRRPIAGGTTTTLAQAAGQQAMTTNATNAYWSEYDLKTKVAKIRSVPLAGGTATDVLTTAANALFITELATYGSNLYFAGYEDVGKRYSLYRLPMSGGTPSVLVEEARVMQLAIDGAALFWTDQTGPIKRIALPGPAAATTVAEGTPGEVWGLAFDSSNVYWTEIFGDKLSRVAKTGGTGETIATGQNHPSGVALDSTSIYWINSGGADGAVLKMAK